MTALSKRLIRYLPLVLGVALLILAAVFVPWHQVAPYMARLSLSTLGLLLLASMLFYFGRTLRYWLMLRMLHENTSLGIVMLACLVAQPIAVLPGGELYRGVMLQRYGNVSLKAGTSSVFSQALAETLGLAAIAVVGTWILHRYMIITTIIAAIIFGLWLIINLYSGTSAHRYINWIPFINIHHQRVASYLRRNRILLSGWNFVILLGASLVTTGAGILLVSLTAAGIGRSLTWPEATLVYVLPTLLEVVSFLPGGLGASEGGSVGLLLLFGIPLPGAVAITIIVRLFTLGFGFIYGFIAQGIAYFGQVRRYDDVVTAHIQDAPQA